MNRMSRLTLAGLGAVLLSLTAIAQPWQSDPPGFGGGRGGRMGMAGAPHTLADANQDGRITQDEAGKMGPRFAQRFAAADADKNGEVTTAELAANCRWLRR